MVFEISSRRTGDLTGISLLWSLRRLVRILSLGCLLLGMAGFSAPALGLLPGLSTVRLPQATSSEEAFLLEVDGIINPVVQRYIARSIKKAEEEEAKLVIIRLDTPGGLLDSTRKIVEELLTASVPTVVYVAPQGARAASAGTFITAAANFAVMAPGTNIGAASPVGSGGEELPETLQSKVTEDAAALMRSIAKDRNRNVEKLEDTVRKATSYDAEEAVELRVVDFIARDMEELLAKLDGRTATTASGPQTLKTGDLAIRNLNMSLIDRFFNILADPNIAFLLFSIGGLGIVVEFFNPGLIFPGRHDHLLDSLWTITTVSLDRDLRARGPTFCRYFLYQAFGKHTIFGPCCPQIVSAGGLEPNGYDGSPMGCGSSSALATVRMIPSTRSTFTLSPAAMLSGPSATALHSSLWRRTVPLRFRSVVTTPSMPMRGETVSSGLARRDWTMVKKT